MVEVRTGYGRAPTTTKNDKWKPLRDIIGLSSESVDTLSVDGSVKYIAQGVHQNLQDIYEGSFNGQKLNGSANEAYRQTIGPVLLAAAALQKLRNTHNSSTIIEVPSELRGTLNKTNAVDVNALEATLCNAFSQWLTEAKKNPDFPLPLPANSPQRAMGNDTVTSIGDFVMRSGNVYTAVTNKAAEAALKQYDSELAQRLAAMGRQRC